MAVPYSAITAPARASQRVTPLYTPDEEESLLRRVGSGALSGLAAVGNLLDVPGSMARDVLGGENPFDQLLSPFSFENRLSGRDLMEKAGILGANKPGFDWGDVAGFAGEVALDPLTYASFGTSALTKGGQIARRAGALRDIGRITGKGNRVGRLTTSLDDLIEQASRTGNFDALGKLEEGARGVGFRNLSEASMAVGKQPLGGLMGVGLPFRPAAGVIGTGPRAQRLAGALDTGATRSALQAMRVPQRFVDPIAGVPEGIRRGARALFDSRVAGKFGRLGQEAAEISTGARRAARPVSEMDVIQGERGFGELLDEFDRLTGGADVGDLPYDPSDYAREMDELVGEALERWRANEPERLFRQKNLSLINKLRRGGDPHTVSKNFREVIEDYEDMTGRMRGTADENEVVEALLKTDPRPSRSSPELVREATARATEQGRLAGDPGFKAGDVVNAADRDNYGWVTRRGPKQSTVLFKNPQTGAVAEVVLDNSQLTRAFESGSRQAADFARMSSAKSLSQVVRMVAEGAEPEEAARWFMGDDAAKLFGDQLKSGTVLGDVIDKGYSNPGSVFRVFDYPDEAIGGTRSFSETLGDWGWGPFAIEARKPSGAARIAHHAGAMTGDVGQSDVVRVFYKPDEIVDEAVSEFDAYARQLQEQFPDAEFVRLADDGDNIVVESSSGGFKEKMQSHIDEMQSAKDAIYETIESRGGRTHWHNVEEGYDTVHFPRSSISRHAADTAAETGSARMFQTGMRNMKARYNEIRDIPAHIVTELSENSRYRPRGADEAAVQRAVQNIMDDFGDYLDEAWGREEIQGELFREAQGGTSFEPNVIERLSAPKPPTGSQLGLFDQKPTLQSFAPPPDPRLAPEAGKMRHAEALVDWLRGRSTVNWRNTIEDYADYQRRAHLVAAQMEGAHEFLGKHVIGGVETTMSPAAKVPRHMAERSRDVNWQRWKWYYDTARTGNVDLQSWVDDAIRNNRVGQSSDYRSDQFYAEWFRRGNIDESEFRRLAKNPDEALSEMEFFREVGRAPISSSGQYGPSAWDELASETERVSRRAVRVPEGSVPLSQAFDDIGMRPGQSLEYFAKKFGMTADEVKNLHVSPEVVSAARGAIQIYDPKFQHWTLDMIDSLTRTFKSSVTVLFPSFAFRNHVSGQFVNMSSGLIDGLGDAGRYATEYRGAYRFLQKARSGELDEAGQALLDELRAHGVFDKHYGFSDIEAPRSISETFLPDAPSPRQMASRARQAVAATPTTLDVIPGVRAGRRAFQTATGVGSAVNSHVEWMNRVPLFTYLRKKGYSAAEAAQEVRRTHFDYGDATRAEREVFKRIFPFWMFSKNAAVLVANQLMDRPGGLLAQTMRATNRMRGEQGGVPDYIAQTAAIPLGTSDDGTQRFLTGFGFAHEDPLTLLSARNGMPDASDTLSELISRSNPLIKAPIELAAGESFFQRGPMGGRELVDMDPTTGRLVSNVGELFGREPMEDIGGRAYPLLGSRNLEHLVANSPLSRGLTTARSLTDPRKYEGPLPGAAAGVNAFTGFRVSDMSPAARDAMLRDILSARVREEGGRTFTRASFPSDAELTQEQLELQQALALLAARAKARRQ